LKLFLSWPLHILGTIFIFVNRAKNVQDKKSAQIRQAAREQAAAAERERRRKEEALLAREKERFTRAGAALKKIYQSGSRLAVDTNVFINEYTSKLIYSLLEKHHITLYVSIVVLDELDGLKNGDGQLEASAREAIRVLEHYQSSGQIRVVKMPDKSFLIDRGFGTTKDDYIAGGYLNEQMDQNKPFIFISNDRMPRVKASAAGLQVFDYFQF